MEYSRIINTIDDMIEDVKFIKRTTFIDNLKK